MKKIVLLFLITFIGNAQTTTEIFKSERLGGDKKIIIGLPPLYKKNATKKYPILVLLDGQYLFEPFMGALNYGTYWDDLPETIVIGIVEDDENTRIENCSYDENNGLPTEKGAAYFEFIGTELLPYIEKKYRTAPFKIIAGHDVTAGFLNYFLYKEVPLFDGYISLSPELAPNMESRIIEALTKSKQKLYYYQSVASGDVDSLKEPIKKLDLGIKAITNTTLNYQFDEFNNTTHYSEVLHAIPTALYQIFDTYGPITSAEYTEKIVALESGYSDYLENKYKLISKELGVKIPVRLNDFKAIETAILKKNAYNELDKLAEIAFDSYPKSMLSTYYLALMYEKKEDFKRAEKKYQTASQLGEIGELTKAMMFQKFDEMKTKKQPK